MSEYFLQQGNQLTASSEDFEDIITHNVLTIAQNYPEISFDPDSLTVTFENEEDAQEVATLLEAIARRRSEDNVRISLAKILDSREDSQELFQYLRRQHAKNRRKPPRSPLD